MRKNPHLDTTKDGRLLVKNGRVQSQSTVWLHFSRSPAQAFLSEGFVFSEGQFYLTNGSLLHLFGPTMVGLEYTPTRLFDPENPQHVDEVMNCILSSASEDDILLALQSAERVFAWEDLDGLTPSAFLRREISYGSFAIYEDVEYVIPCIERCGFTAYLETEEAGGFPDNRDIINIAVLPSDLANLRILDAVTSTAHKVSWDSVGVVCPECGDDTTLSTLAAVIQSLPRDQARFVCKKCAQNPPRTPAPVQEAPPMPRQADRPNQDCRSTDPTVQTLQNLLGALRAAHWSHWTSHWQTLGPTYYGDHLLLQRIYEAMPAEIDTLAEKMVGMYGSAVVDAVCQAHVMIEFLEAQDIPDPISRALAVEEHLQVFLQDVFTRLETSNTLSLGMNDFIAATANAHETFIYLLRQRTR